MSSSSGTSCSGAMVRESHHFRPQVQLAENTRAILHLYLDLVVDFCLCLLWIKSVLAIAGRFFLCIFEQFCCGYVKNLLWSIMKWIYSEFGKDLSGLIARTLTATEHLLSEKEFSYQCQLCRYYVITYKEGGWYQFIRVTLKCGNIRGVGGWYSKVLVDEKRELLEF